KANTKEVSSQKTQELAADGQNKLNDKNTVAERPAAATVAAKAKTASQEPVVAANTTKQAVDNSQQLIPNSTQGNNKNTVNNITPPVQQQADNTRNFKTEKDSMNKLNVVQRWNRKDGFSRDTVGMGKIAMEKL